MMHNLCLLLLSASKLQIIKMIFNYIFGGIWLGIRKWAYINIWLWFLWLSGSGPQSCMIQSFPSAALWTFWVRLLIAIIIWRFSSTYY